MSDDFLDDESFFDEDEFEEDPYSPGSPEEETPSPPPESSAESPSEEAPIAHTPPPRPKATLAEIPVKVHLEISRLNISFEELQKMQPGHRLPLEINPRLVDLVVGGKSIGKGELIEVGETVGVKILELYH